MKTVTAAGRRGSCLGRLLRLGSAASALVLAGLAVWAVVNTPPAAGRVDRDHLTERDLWIVRESQHLRAAVGGTAWPGFADAALALQLYNDRYGFAIGVEAPAGWVEVAANRIEGRPYFRTARPEKQSFAVRVGERWAGSLTVKEVMDAGVPRMFREKLGLVARLVPYQLFVLSTDHYIAVLLHEQFHAFAAEANPRRFERARAAYRAEEAYPWTRDGYRAAWQEETGLLASATDAGDRASRVDLGRRFLEKRRERRQQFLRDAALVEYELELEWLEGLAKYVELESWRKAGQPGYAPLPEIERDPQFQGYARYDAQWRQERTSLRFGVNLRGDVPFYYSGALQAMLLDALEPGWKRGFLAGDEPMETLLDRATSGKLGPH